MGKTLKEIAQELSNSNKKVQLIYGFNGVGKTRLSRIFKETIASKHDGNVLEEEYEDDIKVLYYNAFTEDLFYWDNDLDNDVNRKLNIIPNNFTRWILEDQGQENNIKTLFQNYTNDKLTPNFNFKNNNTEVYFSIEAGNEEKINNIKISRGEESCFIWCIFFSFITQVIDVLNDNEDRSTEQFNKLEYIFIDDPVSSLDENHLIELAVNISDLIKSSTSNLKFIITTHNSLFYNILYNELGLKRKNARESPCAYMLDDNEDGTFEITPKFGDSNMSFSYHLFLKQTIEDAIKSCNIQKYHFTLLRNLYEKTANFLGYPKWSDLLPDDKKTYYNRIIQFTSHSTLSNETVAEPTTAEKETVKYLLNHLVKNRYWKEEQQ